VLPEVPQMATVTAAAETLLSSLQHFISTTHRSHAATRCLMPCAPIAHLASGSGNESVTPNERCVFDPCTVVSIHRRSRVRSEASALTHSDILSLPESKTRGDSPMSLVVTLCVA